MIVIPAIDLKDGSCVRLFQGDFEQVTEYSDEPVGIARQFSEAGFTYLHIVDLDGAREGTQRNQERIRDIFEATAMSVQVGGGIRDSMTVDGWLDAGVSRCVIGSAAVTNPMLVERLLDVHGPDKIVLALDVRIDSSDVPMISTHGWTRSSGQSLWQCVDRYSDAGLQHVLCTDVGRDGTLSGPNIDLYEEFTRRYPALKLQASGGVRSIGDLARTAECGAWGTITGRALLDGRIGKEEIATFLQSE